MTDMTPEKLDFKVVKARLKSACYGRLYDNSHTPKERALKYDMVILRNLEYLEEKKFTLDTVITKDDESERMQITFILSQKHSGGFYWEEQKA